jgi:hypothetical protein
MKYFISILFTFHFFITSYCQPESGGKIEAGKCYAKCLIGEQYEKEEITIFQYTGVDFKSRKIKKQTVITSPESRKFISVKDTSCLKPNEADCIKSTMVVVPETSEEIYIVKDTNKVKDFKIRNVFQNKLVKSGTYEWRQIVCQDDLTSSLILEIRKALIAEGYSLSLKKVVDKEFYTAFNLYQKKNNLLPGPIDYVTLRSLGIKQ